MNNMHLNKMKMTCSLKINVAFTLLCLYFASTSLSYIPWIPEIVCTLSLYGFVIVTIVGVLIRKKLVVSPYMKWYLVFFLICLLSSLYSPQITSSIKASIGLIKVLLFIYCFQEIVNTDKKLNDALAVYSISTIILFVYLFYMGLLSDDSTGRLGQELTGNANTFASIYMIASIASIVEFFGNKAKVSKMVFFAFFILQEYALILSGGRKFFVIPVLVFAVTYLVNNNIKKNGLIYRVIFICIALMTTWYMIFNIPAFYNSIGIRFEGLFASFSGKGTIDYSTLERMKMMQSAFSGWLDSPLWGHGIDSFKTVAGFDSYAHNNYLELLFDLGMIGFIVYYYYIVISIVGLLRKGNKDTRIWLWLCVGLGILLFDIGAVSYNLPHTQMMISIIGLQNYKLDFS